MGNKQGGGGKTRTPQASTGSSTVQTIGRLKKSQNTLEQREKHLDRQIAQCLQAYVFFFIVLSYFVLCFKSDRNVSMFSVFTFSRRLFFDQRERERERANSGLGVVVRENEMCSVTGSLTRFFDFITCLTTPTTHTHTTTTTTTTTAQRQK